MTEIKHPSPATDPNINVDRQHTRRGARPTESVWDYPRPPAAIPDDRPVRVETSETILGDTTSSVRVLETSHPPVFYIHERDVDMERLMMNSHITVCEFKGRASYYDLILPGRVVLNVGWTYPDPTPEFSELRGMIAFYPAKVDCYVDDVRVGSQEGGFYGGWITPEIEGPFKGAPSTTGW